MKDKDDRALEALFHAASIPDAGFSDGVVARVRRRMWLQRLVVPAAAALGGLLAFRPMVDMLAALRQLVAAIPTDAIAVPAASLPQISTVLIVASVFIAALCVVPLLDE